VTIPVIWLAFALSLLVHVAMLWFWLPDLRKLAAGGKIAEERSNLAVRLEPRPAPRASEPPAPGARAVTPSPAPPTSPPAAERSPPRRMLTVPPKTAPRIAQPPIVADRMPEPSVAPIPPPRAAPPPPVIAPTPPVATAPAESDLSAYIDARRRARGEVPSSASDAAPGTAESDIERRDRIVASNLGLDRTPSFGYDPKSAGGIFQITDMNADYADFYYFGLNREIRRNTKQRYEVRRGSESDIRLAIVHKMIAIIRESVSGDFLWLSRRGPVTMSARPADNAELEAFILSDVFPGERVMR
jgi:hypothetical protein